jgi:hypothetical protein
MDQASDEEQLRARFALVELDGDGVLLDGHSGAIYQLNRTGCQIWAALLRGDSVADISGDLMGRFGLTRAQAERDTLAALHDRPEALARAPVDRGRWSSARGGYAFFQDDALVCEISSAGGTLRLGSGVRPAEPQARAYLKSVAPKILALRRICVLHASAVETEGSLLVFSGRSGAGKTTSARAFARNGARLISEDLLVLGGDLRAPEAVIGGEPAIGAWIAAQAQALAADPTGPIDCRGLDRCVEGARIPVGRILLIDADRRAGDRITLEPLARCDALVALLESIYFASAEAESWRDSFELLRGIATAVPTARASMPRRLLELPGAVKAFPGGRTRAP